MQNLKTNIKSDEDGLKVIGFDWMPTHLYASFPKVDELWVLSELLYWYPAVSCLLQG
ncbi:hypothetical protein LguiA_029152 [Lonicera macranthoides]